MKRILLLAVMAGHLSSYGQITTPIIKARFGVDADVRANFFNGFVQTGNDDWYNLVAIDTSGKAVIDTTGMAAILAGYLSDVSPWPKRMGTYYRTMSRPTYSIVNNRLWLDAIWIRDYHGNDTTVFTSGSDKNGMSPALWTGGIQSIPDKNDILDMFMHVRRAGPNSTDSLWFFGGISLDNTTGNRYFDFEMYQTDIYYNRPNGKWYGYGPDFGHTSWEFDAAGNITKPGDIIFSAEYQSSTLTNIQARVWVKKTVWQTVTPTAFSWSGLFDGDGAGATWGYASITPKTTGAFYTGLGSSANTWGGPVRVVLQDNSLATNYAKDQFMEFSVNLSKLGLDPVLLMGGDICGTPFNRIVVKTRASASFTAELKDFVAPTDLFLAPRADVATATPYICDTGSIAEIHVSNPLSTSYYEWVTPNGNIVGPTTGTTIIVDTPGVYIVKQYLQVGCSSVYASVTIQILSILDCYVLQSNMFGLEATLQEEKVRLSWKVLNNYITNHFIVERSPDGLHFTTIGVVNREETHDPTASYGFTDQTLPPYLSNIYYRVKLVENNGFARYSPILKISCQTSESDAVAIYPNPAKNDLHLQVNTSADNLLQVMVYDFNGKLIYSEKRMIRKGYNNISLDEMAARPSGIYNATVKVGKNIFNHKIIILP